MKYRLKKLEIFIVLIFCAICVMGAVSNFSAEKIEEPVERTVRIVDTIYSEIDGELKVKDVIKRDVPYIDTIKFPESEPDLDKIYLELSETSPAYAVTDEVEYEYVGEFTLTAYCLCPECCGKWSKQHPSRINDTSYVQKTASGTIPEPGRTIGANTSILPYGTVVLIDDKEYVVEDTGGACKRNKYLIDILFEDHSSANEFGKQKAQVYIKVE